MTVVRFKIVLVSLSFYKSSDITGKLMDDGSFLSYIISDLGPLVKTELVAVCHVHVTALAKPSFQGFYVLAEGKSLRL